VDVPIPVGAAWNLARRLFVGRLDVRVRVHTATLVRPYRADAVVINVTNQSPRRSVKPTHVTVLSEPPVAVVNPRRPLRTLAPNGDSWETWVARAELPDPSQDVRDLVQVRLSTGELIRSTRLVPHIELLPGADEILA
jgi:hypothetical protein